MVGISLRCVCRGSDRIYLLVKTSEPMVAEDVVSRVLCEGRELPSYCYPFCRMQSRRGAAIKEWLVEIPLLDAPKMDVGLLLCGEETAELSVSSVILKWMSRLNYRLRPSLCAEMKRCGSAFQAQRYQMSMQRFLVGNGTDLWRIAVSWSGDEIAKPVVEVFDIEGGRVESFVHFFEFNSGADVDSPHRLDLSIEVPRGLRSFYMTARDPRAHDDAAIVSFCGILPGFCSMNAEQYGLMRGETIVLMSDARQDDRGYGRWFAAQRVTKGELAAQRERKFSFEPLVSIVVPCFKSNKRYLREMILSVVNQSYARWELVLLDASSAEGTVKKAADSFADARIRYFDLEGNRGIVGNTNFGIEASEGSFVAFLDHDDTIEPDTLFRYVEMINEHPDAKAFFCDEDLLDEKGRYARPVFKTRLNLDLLYSHNCVTHFLMIDRAYLLDRGLSDDAVSGAQDYDLALKAYEGGAPFLHIPRILYHWRMHPGSTCGDNEGGKPYAQEAGRLALQRHLDRRGVASSVEETKHLYVYRVRYALPDPLPLVSIVIPSKDQTSILEACLNSLAKKATYPNFEVVVVENNSEEEGTIDSYRELEKRFSFMRVVRWEGAFNYSAIVNYGVSESRGEYILLLNNDTEVITPDFIEEMLGYLLREEVGVVGAKLYFRDGTVQHAGTMITSRGEVAHVNQNFNREREGYLAKAVRPGNFSGVTGACQMVRRGVFEELGGYDEAFAVGFNDVDFCFRLMEAGYRVVYTPYAELYHYEFVSRGRETEDPAKLERWRDEKDRFSRRWGIVLEKGDPYGSPNLDADSPYYALGKSGSIYRYGTLSSR